MSRRAARRRGHFRRVAAAALAAAALVSVMAPAPASADPVPSNATWAEEWFSSGDGTMLHADVFLPAARDDGQRHPVILSVGPYFGSGGSSPYDVTPLNEGPVTRFRDLMTEGRIFDRGYAFVQVDLRGTGGSEGCYDLGGPGEQMDVKAAVEWAASQPWSNGKVAMWGKSYDAWTQVMGLAMEPRGLVTAVIQAPLASLYRGLYMNGISYGWYETPAVYGLGDIKPPSLADSTPQELIFGLSGATDPGCYAENLTETLNPDASTPYYKARDLLERAADTDVPTLWSHGFLDANTKPDNFIDLYERLRAPKRAWVGQFNHVRGNEASRVGRTGFMDEAMDWLDHHLRGRPLENVPTVEVQDNLGRWRGEAQWPPADAAPHVLTMNGGSYIDTRGNDAWGPAGGVWTFTQPARHELWIAGEPTLRSKVVTSVSRANVIVLLYDVASNGTARLITRGGSVTTEGEVAFDLYPQDWVIRPGHRVALHVSGSDESWFSPLSSQAEVKLEDIALSVPFLTYLREPDLAGTRAEAMRWVPEVSIDAATIHANERQVRLPKRMRARRR